MQQLSATGGTRRLEGKRCLVTGAAQGIGRAIVTAFLREGALVAGLDVCAPAEPLAAALKSSTNGQALLIDCDVTKSDAVRAAVESIAERFGSLNVLVNNAGVNTYFDATTMSEMQWDAFFAIDLKAAWLCAKAAIPYLLEAPGGSIINISSLHATLTTEGMFPYAAAKAGLVGLTKSLALDYGPRGIRVNAVAPGFTQTRLVDDWLAAQTDAAAMHQRMIDAHPLRRIAQPEDVANMVVFLASDDARAVTGGLFPVDCGLSARFAI
jgi:NAD(P)-dependent dehydrogenase (short-subunit alcohol dehydrogenase family)